MSCKKCKCKVCSCIKNDVPKIAVNGIVQNQNENDVVNIKVPTKTSQLINDSGFGQGEGLESNLDYIRVNGNLVPIINKVAQISVPTKTSDLENDSNYTTNDKLNKEIQDRISADNLKLDKPTTVGNISEYPDVVVVNSSGNSAKLGASELVRVESTGDGTPIYGGKQNDKNIIKSIKSNTLYIGDNNGSIEINTVPKYNWISYANDTLGKDIGMSSLNDDGTTKSYIGFAYNKNTELPSLNYTDYTWVKLKGNDGHTDYVLDISNDNIVIPTDSNGKIGTTSLDYASSELRLYYGNSIVNKSEYFPIIKTSSGIIYSIDNSNPEYDKINLTSVDFSGTTGFINISIYGDSSHSELLAKGTINVIKLIGLDSYEIVTSVKTIKVTQETNTESEIIEPTTITAKVIKNTGFEVKETTEGTLAYKYSYQLPMEKGTEITPGQSVTISNNNQPVYIEFNYYSPKSGGIVIDRETVPFVRDGKDGLDAELAYTLDISNESHNIPTNSEGKTTGATSYIGADTLVTLYKGETIIPIEDWDLEITQSGGIIYTTTNVDSNNINIVVSDVNNMDDSGYLNVVAKAKGGAKVLGRAKFSISKSKGTFSLKLQPSVNQIIISYSSDGNYVINPTEVNVKLLKNDGNYISEITDYDIAYKFNESPVENLIQPGGSIPISYNGSILYLELKVYDKTNNSLLLDKETIPFVKSGVPGVPGSRGSAIRILEWREGYTYVNNNDFRDYIYYRTSNPTYEGWYVTKGLSAVANSGYPDLNLFEKQPFTESSIFGNIIAENANLAGFIFRNQKLYSQLGLDTENAEPQFSNLMLNGSQGYMQFAKNFLLQKEGIYQKDVKATSGNKNRLALEFVQGTPRLRMWHPNGVLGIEMGIIEGVLTLNFYDSEGNLVYKLGQTGIIYVDRVAASYTTSSYVEFTSASYSDDAALKTEFLSRAKATRISTVNERPENRHLLYECASVPNKTLLSYNAGKNEDSENNKQYESLLFLQQGTNLDNPATKAKFTGVLTSTKIDDTVFHGTWSDGVNSESNVSGYLYYNTISQTANTVEIKVYRYVNGAVVESKTIDIGTVRVSDLPN